MEVSSIVLRSEDVDRSARFWTDKAGLTIERQMPGYTFLDGGPIPIILSAKDSVTDDSFTEVVFAADDVRGTHKAMADRGVSFEFELRAVTSHEGRDLLASSFRDPDGH